MTAIEEFIYFLYQTPRWRENIVSINEQPPADAQLRKYPAELAEEIKQLLRERGISAIYSHQLQAIEAIFHGEHVVISTGVASGKSLCYQIPILQNILCEPTSHSLLMYPTKALAQDQAQKMSDLSSALYSYTRRPIFSGIYDGDTPATERNRIRKQANILFTNPDMLHLGILPNHSLWSSFFAKLRYVVIDEVHYYRGVFGSHFANVLRRLKRICRLYGSEPVFICTSATLANARELASDLLGQSVVLIEKDGSPHGKRVSMILNPPMINHDLGIRRSSLLESSSIAKVLLQHPLQAILFSVSRRSVEMLLLRLMRWKDKVRSYRSGYLASERRQIENDLREGNISIVASTSALELGIDIGGLDAVIINGYPGTISGTRQEAGRAGRKGNTSLAILVAGSNPLDQYICTHPEYLWENSPEHALIDPNNTEILLKQLHCAVSEMSFIDGESFGTMEYNELWPYLQILTEDNRIRRVGNKFMGMVNSYPAAEVSLRNAGSQYPIIAEGETIGYVDAASALWMTHPNAIYLHAGETWIVKELSFEKSLVNLDPIESDYYTQALQDNQIELKERMLMHQFNWGMKHFSKVRVITTITGFKKLKFASQEVLGYETLDLPQQILDTVSWWISLSPEIVESIRNQGMWNNDPNDYGKSWQKIRDAIRQRDAFKCCHCGAIESNRQWDVHHKVPLRKFASLEEANAPENLVTLCPRCHHLAEQQVRIQSGLSGLAYLLWNLAPFFVMCDLSNLGMHSDAESDIADGLPVIALYDMIPGGIGLCRKLYDLQEKLLKAAYEQVKNCQCSNGCPACVGPVAENGLGAKDHAIAILKELTP